MLLTFHLFWICQTLECIVIGDHLVQIFPITLPASVTYHYCVFIFRCNVVIHNEAHPAASLERSVLKGQTTSAQAVLREFSQEPKAILMLIPLFPILFFVFLFSFLCLFPGCSEIPQCLQV